MGHPKFPRKQYDTPLHPWKEERIKQEREFMKKYGLKNHQEIWRAKTFLGKYRQHARELLARMGSRDPQIKREGDQLLFHLTRMGILPLGGSLDDVLALEIESVLSRRLQTLVYLKGFSSTADQSRQLINHGHVKIGDHKVTIPGYLVTKDEEGLIGYTAASPLNELSHPARPKSDMIGGGPITRPSEEKAPIPSKEPSDPKQPKQTETTPSSGPTQPKNITKTSEQKKPLPTTPETTQPQNKETKPSPQQKSEVTPLPQEPTKTEKITIETKEIKEEKKEKPQKKIETTDEQKEA